MDDDDEDDLERVSWTGEPVGSKYKRPWEGINYSGALKSSLGREAKGEHYKCCEQLK